MFKTNLRNHEIYLACEQGIKLSELSKKYSLSRARVYQIYHKVDIKIKYDCYHDPTNDNYDWLNGLSERIGDKLLSAGFENKNDLISTMVDGVLPSIHLVGKKSKDEIYKWLDLPNLDNKPLDLKILKAIELLKENGYEVKINV